MRAKLLIQIFSLIIVLLLCGQNLFADELDSKGKDFWITYLPNYHNNRYSDVPELQLGDSLYIFINSEQKTSGKIVYFDKFGVEHNQNFNIADPAQMYVFKVSFFDFELAGFNDSGIFSQFQSDKKSFQSFHVTSDQEVTVYAHSQAVTTSDAFLVLPADVLGQSYYVMAYNADATSALNQSWTPSQFAIVATQEYTSIDITTTAISYSYPVGTRKLVLNKGEVYLVQSFLNSSPMTPDMTGSYIRSDKPIAVFSGQQRSKIPVTRTGSNSSRDCLIEQLPPVSTWGLNAFLVAPQESNDFNSKKGSLYRILAANDNTALTVNGILVTTLNKGGFYEAPLNSPKEISADKPILAAIFKYTASDSSGQYALGDPFMMLIPPKEQFIKKCKVINIQAWEYDEFNFSYSKVYIEQYITIIAPEGSRHTVKLDGAYVPVSSFYQIQNSGYFYAHLKVTDGVHDIECEDQIGVYIYGYGRANSYGYIGGMGFKQITKDPPRITTVDSCFKVTAYLSTSNIKLVVSNKDSLINCKTLWDIYFDGDSTIIYINLISNRFDGKSQIEVTDSSNKIITKLVEIPGLTLALKGLSGSDSVPVLKYNIFSDQTINVDIHNYGKFTKSAVIARLKNQSAGTISNTPFGINPGQEKQLSITYIHKNNKVKRDTLYLDTPCGLVEIAIIEINSSACDETEFTFADFSDASKLIFNGQARKVQKYLRMTENVRNQIGSVWYNTTVPVLDGFTTEFAFRFSNGENFQCVDGSLPGADGIAFVVQNASPNAIGYIGGGIGYEGIRNSLAVEFDTFSNDSTQIENYFDPNGNHVAVNSNGTLENTSKHLPGVMRGINKDIIPIKSDGTIYYSKIEFLEDGTFLVYLDTVPNPTKLVLKIEEHIDFKKLLNLDRGYRAFVGFTSATGCAVENHQILSWSFCPNHPNPANGVYEDKGNLSDILIVDPSVVTESARIRINLQTGMKAELIMIDLLGNKVAEIFNGSMTSDAIGIQWSPESISNGMYLLVLKFNDKIMTTKVNILR